MTDTSSDEGTVRDMVASLDRLVHEPARLAVLTVLSKTRKVDFTFLQKLIGLSQGNLSAHLTKLENAGLVAIEKSFRGKRPLTQIALTLKGRRALESHWSVLDGLRES